MNSGNVSMLKHKMQKLILPPHRSNAIPFERYYISLYVETIKRDKAQN